MSWGIVAGVAGTVIGAGMSSRASDKATEAGVAGNREALELQRQSRDIAREDYRPYREAGYTALNRLMEMTGLDAPAAAAGVSRGVGRNRWGTGPRGEIGRPDAHYLYEGAYDSALPATIGSQGMRSRAAATQQFPGGPASRASAYDALMERNPAMADRFKSAFINNEGQNAWDQIYAGRAYGGDMIGRAYGGNIPPIGKAHGGDMKNKALYIVNELGPEDVYDNGTVTRSSNPKVLPPNPNGYVGRDNGGDLWTTPTEGVMGPRGLPGPRGVPVGWGGPTRLTRGPADGKAGAADYYPDFSKRWAGPGPAPTSDKFPTYGGTSGVDGTTVQPLPGTGAPTPAAVPAAQNVNNALNGGGYPTENQFDMTVDPGYRFRFDEGMRALDRGAAARGGLLSGGYGRRAMRYGQGFASNEFSNIYNRISNIAGLGQVGTQGSAGAALTTGQGMGASAADAGLTSAYGQMAGGNAWANAANQIGQLPWDRAFNRPAATSRIGFGGVNPGGMNPYGVSNPSNILNVDHLKDFG